MPPLGFLRQDFDALVAQRHAEHPAGSYTTQLFDNGIRAVARKLGQGRRAAMAAVVQDDEALLGEAADLMFHLTVAGCGAACRWATWCGC
ncbi:Histidine biosynthesis bifunctional protein HisIE OS=Rhodanobacter lindaniclasticus OX=75310 GN=hisI PE=3 SV=1 [Rhodanobacter lindaniclasticus]